VDVVSESWGIEGRGRRRVEGGEGLRVEKGRGWRRVEGGEE